MVLRRCPQRRFSPSPLVPPSLIASDPEQLDTLRPLLLVAITSRRLKTYDYILDRIDDLDSWESDEEEEVQEEWRLARVEDFKIAFDHGATNIVRFLAQYFTPAIFGVRIIGFLLSL